MSFRHHSYDVLPSLLSWKDAGCLLEDLQFWYTQRVYSEVCEALVRLGSNNPQARWLRSTIDSLPEPFLRRFLLAPETRRRISKLRWNTEDHIDYLSHSIMAELRLSGKCSLSEACWTGLGDILVGSDKETGRFNTAPRGVSMKAPLALQLPVDFGSPHAQLINSMAQSVYEAYESDVAVQLVEHLQKALSIVERTNQATAALISASIRVVVPRIYHSNSQVGFGSSTPSHIGRLLFRNAHLMNTAALLDALVHEAIHAFLYMFELSEPLVLDLPYEEQPLVRSPWSGRELPLYTYVHACFVWYGLVHFWAAVRKKETFPSLQSTILMRKALQGFEGGDPETVLLSKSRLLGATTITALVACREMVHELRRSEGAFPIM